LSVSAPGVKRAIASNERDGDSLVTVNIVGRLENIIARNQRPRGSRERFYVMVGFGVAILVIIVLMTFTDLGAPPVPVRAAPPAVEPRGKRVDGVLLRAPAPARPAQPAQPAH
jgi:hypothetical protein